LSSPNVDKKKRNFFEDFLGSMSVFNCGAKFLKPGIPHTPTPTSPPKNSENPKDQQHCDSSAF
jgi:hypothetical protein